MKTALKTATLLLALFFLNACASKNPPSADPAQRAVDLSGADSMYQQIFETCDTNRDKKISSDEYAHGVIMSFHQLDKNGNLKLETSELSNAWDAEAKAVDLDKDGLLTLSEILEHQANSFKLRDVDGCGRLTEKDVRIWVVQKLAEQQGCNPDGTPLKPSK